MKHLADRRRRSSSRAVVAKRLLDVSCAAMGLIITSPLLLSIGLLVRLGSPGPVLFRQERVGRYGHPFNIHKFRTMRTGSAGPRVSAEGDSRVTRVGAVLRRTKLDELPQLVNVLSGQMSLVGPRPEVPEYVQLWEADAMPVILSVRPGITDPASIAFRDEGEQLARATDPEDHYVRILLPQKTALYLDYVQTWSLAGDLRILLNTARVVLRA